ncbi:MAG: hypothetical protein WCO40_03250 [Thermoleophilia bacterium]
MSLFFSLLSAASAAFVIVTIFRLARGNGVVVARVTLPLAIVVVMTQMSLHHWSLEAFLLLAALIVSAGALALRGRGREHGPTWIALGVFAAAGLAGGFGLLAQGLCVAGNSYNCGGTGPDALAIAGWAVALCAYGYLAWGALRP